jgi:hypothetical protein
MSEYDDSHMLSKILERMAAQSLHLKDKIDSGLEIPSWAEYKLYNAYSGLGKALGTAYPGTYGEEKMAAFSGALDRHPALKGKQSQLPDKIQAGIIKKKLRMRKQAASTESQLLQALSAEGGAAGMKALRKRVKEDDLQQALKSLIASGKVRRHPDGDLIKESEILPEFLVKPRRDGFIDPRDDDFSKNQAFGRAMGVGLLPVTAGAGIGIIGGNPALGTGIAGLGALSGYGMYRHKLRQFRELQAQGKNPVTGKMHDPERIEKTRRWAERVRQRKDRSAQAKLNRQTGEDLKKQAAATATKTDPAGAIGGVLAANATVKNDAKSLVGKTKEAAAKTLGEGALMALGLPGLASKYNKLKSERLSKLLQTTVPGTEGIHLPGMPPERIERMADMFSHPETAAQFAAPFSFLHMPVAEVAKTKMRGLADLGPKTALASATATKTDPAKWEAAKREAKSKMGGKHSARAMQLATQIYKKKGGGYSGAKPTSQNNSLKKWTKQKWQWSGGDKPGQGGKGVYLPKAKKDRLKDSEHGRRLLARASKKKSEATRKGEQYSSHGLAANTSLKAKR